MITSVCFMWSVLAAIHPVKQSAERLHHYHSCQDELDFTGIEFPVAIDKIGKFERQNNILVLKTCSFPCISQRNTFDTHVDLLRTPMETIRHYCLIKDLNKLLYNQNRKKGANVLLPLLSTWIYSRRDLLQDHQPNCSHTAHTTYPAPWRGQCFTLF